MLSETNKFVFFALCACVSECIVCNVFSCLGALRVHVVCLAWNFLCALQVNIHSFIVIVASNNAAILMLQVEKVAENSMFIPFEVKKDMTLAPSTRHTLTDENKKCLDDALASAVSYSCLSKDSSMTFLLPQSRYVKICISS
jgi:hypothetical protein